MPDNTRPPRHLVDPDPRPTLGVRALMNAVEELARARGLGGARVAYKRNDRGDHVVALIFPAQPGSPPGSPGSQGPERGPRDDV